MGEPPGKSGRSLPRGVSVSRSDLWNRPEGGSPLPSDSVQPLDAWPSLPPSLNPKPSRDLDPRQSGASRAGAQALTYTQLCIARPVTFSLVTGRRSFSGDWHSGSNDLSPKATLGISN